MSQTDITAAEKARCLANPWNYLDTLAGHYANDEGDGPDDDVATCDTWRKAITDWLILTGIDDCPYDLTGSTTRDRLPNPNAFDAALGAVLKDDCKGVFLWGETGSGKTRAAIGCFVVWLLVNRRNRRFGEAIFRRCMDTVRDDVVLWVEGDTFKTRATSAARSADAWRDVRDELGTVPVLILDDVNHTATDSAAEMLLSVTRQRMDAGRGRFTIVTSNFSGSEIARRNRALGAVVRRWRENLLPVAFDLRPVKFAKTAETK